MLIHDIYTLGESNSFEIKTHEEVTVNLELEKIPPCYPTLLTGIVFCKGFPIRNATIMVMDDNYNPLASDVTDENGKYKFSNILMPGQYKAIASAIGYNISDIHEIVINPNEETKLAFPLKKSFICANGLVYGRILEVGSAKPIEDAEIYLKCVFTDKIYKTMSNHSGQYLIYDLLPNKYKIVVKKQGYMVSEPLVLKIEKYDRTCLYFDLIRDTDDCKNTISGMITVDKSAVCKAAVFLYLLDEVKNEKIVQVQETNKHGFFIFSNVESGSYLVKGKQQNSVIYEKSFVIK